MKLPRTSHERDVFQHLADAQRSSGKDHHIVPLLDSFEDEREPELAFFVMRLLRRFDEPPFEHVSDLVDLFKQLLEVPTPHITSLVHKLINSHFQGLVFMHSKNVAHR